MYVKSTSWCILAEPSRTTYVEVCVDGRVDCRICGYVHYAPWSTWTTVFCPDRGLWGNTVHVINPVDSIQFYCEIQIFGETDPQIREHSKDYEAEESTIQYVARTKFPDLTFKWTTEQTRACCLGDSHLEYSECMWSELNHETRQNMNTPAEKAVQVDSSIVPFQIAWNNKIFGFIFLNRYDSFCLREQNLWF